MDFRIFYSWQSDLPNPTNRGFIQDALERAARNVARDDTVEVEPVVDRDTQGLTGSPAIDHAIFEKIGNAQSFVADVSIINAGAKGRKTPNPNVLLELGFAAKALGWDRVVLVFNTATGDPTVDLPFDLRPRRRIEYAAEPGETDRSEAKQILIATLETAIRQMIDLERNRPAEPAAPSVLDLAIQAVESQIPARATKVRTFLDGLIQELERIAPDWNDQSEPDDQLMVALDLTPPLVCGFARLCQTIAQVDDRQSVNELHRFFEQLLVRYDLPPRFSGSYNAWQFDFWKFMGHELFVTCVQYLLEERRWGTLTELLEREFHSPRAQEVRNTPLQSFVHLSAHLELLRYRKNRLKLKWITVHGQTLVERHGEGGIVSCVPLAGFQEAELFLFMKGEFLNERGDQWADWIPWTSLYYRGIPRFISESRRKAVADEVMTVLGASSLEHMRERLKERIPFLRDIWREAFPYELPFDLRHIDEMGSR